MSWYISLIIILLPFGELIAVTVSGFRIRLLDFLVFFGVIYALFKQKNFFREFYKSGILPLALVIISSALFIHPSFNSIGYASRTILYFFAFVWLISEHPKKNNYYSIFISVILLCIIGVAQYVLFPSLRTIMYLGYDPHLGRLTGAYLDPNIMGGALAFFLLFLIAYKKPPIVFRSILIVVVSVCLLLTYSRVSIVTAVVGILYFFGMSGSKYFLRISIAILCILLIILPILPRAREGSGTSFLRVNSILSKQESLNQTLELTKKTYGLGIGFNNLSSFAIDNTYLTLIATTGIFGVFTYIYFIVKRARVPSIASASLAIMMGVHSLSVNSFFTPSLFILWSILTLLSLPFYSSPGVPASPGSPQRRSQQ